ncbi:MAG: type II toxin-antitoxin system HicB family antitoxin [Patescibacteria group bacterium]
MAKLNKKNYLYSVFYDAAEEGGYAAHVPALPGCHTQGESLEEAERNIKEAIEAYLESLAIHGEDIPEETRAFQGMVKISVSSVR